MLQAELHGSAVHLRVADTGSGITPEELPYIFERFYRAGPARQQSAGSSGLGLAIAKGIVEAHGGSIAVESTAGHGTTFIISLPAANAVPNPPEAEHASSVDSAHAPIVLPSGRDDRRAGPHTPA